MPRKSIVTGKSPLHPSALRLRDLTPGRNIIAFNLEYGSLGEYIVLGYPFVKYEKFLERSYIKVLLRNVRWGGSSEHFLGDLGITPYSHAWNDRNFVVDYRKQHLLPDPDPSLHDPTFDDMFEYDRRYYRPRYRSGAARSYTSSMMSLHEF